MEYLGIGVSGSAFKAARFRVEGFAGCFSKLADQAPVRPFIVLSRHGPCASSPTTRRVIIWGLGFLRTLNPKPHIGLGLYDSGVIRSKVSA